MKLLQKLTDSKGLENYQENVFEEVCFSKNMQTYRVQTATLLLDYNTIILHIFFEINSENHKFLRENPMVVSFDLVVWHI